MTESFQHQGQWRASAKSPSVTNVSIPSPLQAQGRNGHGQSPVVPKLGKPIRERDKFSSADRLINPPIEDKFGRFVIREFKPTDLPRLKELNGDVYFAHLRLPPDPETGNPGGPEGFLRSALHQQRTGPERTDFYLAIEDKETKELIGSVMLYDYKSESHHATIAYLVDPSYHKIRIATDATIRLLVRVTTALGLQEFDATIDPKNTASINLIRRLGFNKVGDLFTSDYPANPQYPENFDYHNRLKNGIRQRYEITLAALLERTEKLESSWKGGLDQGVFDAKRSAMQAARSNREFAILNKETQGPQRGFGAFWRRNPADARHS